MWEVRVIMSKCRGACVVIISVLLASAATAVGGQSSFASAHSSVADPSFVEATANQASKQAAPKTDDTGQKLRDRQLLLQQVATVSGIPWNVLAAIDQYDRSIRFARKIPAEEGLISVYYSEGQWAGLLNPDPNEQNPRTIALFGGVGKDGDGDGLADRRNDIDVLYTLTTHLIQHRDPDGGLDKAIWEQYHNPRSVDRIRQFAKIYETFGATDLREHAFPLPLGANYTYRSTWGASRGWGGSRIHEGTDLFAGYGVTVRSTCYGIIEVRGWNPYGGWRIGIRDLNNVYHYYAHLSGFNKKLKQGDVVKPGDTVGWVGSSGYGKPGTSGKFPPHLHYGLYRDTGLSEWSFDPYPYLRKWEREERKRK
jgi:murein DD-endopeptidase MepM/ murein hydrolase activator NlpD